MTGVIISRPKLDADADNQGFNLNNRQEQLQSPNQNAKSKYSITEKGQVIAI